jgi:hypothetical protein
MQKVGTPCLDGGKRENNKNETDDIAHSKVHALK